MGVGALEDAAVRTRRIAPKGLRAALV